VSRKRVSRFPADILNPLIGQSELFVKNSKQLAEELSSVQMEEDELLVSRDVVSLFTSTPVKESLEAIIRERLQCHSEWRCKTLLEIDDIMQLLEFILSTTYFCFSGQIYKQKFGTAMGSPVSPLVANMFM